MIIYKATNKITNKSYIGQTMGYFSRRKYQHIYNAYKKQSKCYFHRALKKYGPENFEWTILEKCNYIYQLNEMEYHYIKQYNTKIPYGYNLTDGYDKTTYGLKFTKEQKQLISNRTKSKNNPNYGNGDKIRGDKNPAKRPEVRKKISISKLGKNRPDVSEYKSKCYLIYNIKTGKEQIIKNLMNWNRKNPEYKRTGLKNVINGKWSQYKGLWIKKID